MSAQRRQDYAISPPEKEIASNNLKRFCSGALLCFSILGSITACQSKNSSVKNSTVESTNPRANQPFTRGSSQLNTGEESFNLQPILPTFKPQGNSTSVRGTKANTRTNQVNDSASNSKTPAFPQIDTTNISKATQSLYAPKYNFSIDIPDALIQEQTAPKEKINPTKQKAYPNDQKNNITEEETNKGRKLIKAISKVKTPQIYQSQQLGFRFRYPKGYVINKAQNNPKIDPDSVQQRIDLWSNKDHEAIQAGKFQGTELPANVSISVEKNPKRLTASQWLEENNDEFGKTKSQRKQVIAGQKAVAFSSSGLYETQNIVLPSKDGENVIVISHHSYNQEPSDKDYKKLFEEIVSSFELQEDK